MTKKAEKAAEVAANKYFAYAKKVRALAGWVRVSDIHINSSYEAKMTAEDCAIFYACSTAVGVAIWPLKVAAVQAAGKAARDDIEDMAKNLEAVAWNLDALAPLPRFNDGDYQVKRMVRSRYENAFKTEWKRDAPTIASRDDERETRHIARAEESAAYQYSLFVLKLVNKIGAGAVSATLEGDHVWNYSVLTVTMTDGSVQRWKTQQITNCSKLGLWFPQWPSRLMKGEK